MPIRIESDADYSQSGDLVAQRGSPFGDAYTMGHGDHKAVTLHKAGLTVDEAFNLIDLSDTTNFPHTETGKIRLYALDILIEKTAADSTCVLYIGMITEVDATNGTAEWLWVISAMTALDGTDSTDYRHYRFVYPDGLDLEVDSANDKMANALTNSSLSDTTWQTDVDLDSPAGDTTSPPGDGDLVMWFDVTAGTITITVTAAYVTEAA